MEKKNKHYHWILRLMCASILMTGLAACSSSEGSDDPDTPDKPKPDVPVAEGDWQVVPATGGTITKDSLSITFPSGTFAEDTKVAITEIKKGDIGGKYEASKFYQITLPSNAGKPMTVKMKSSDNSEDISFVANSIGFCMTGGTFMDIETITETRYSNGEYSTTIPAFDKNNPGDENVYFSIGLGHMINYKSGNVRTRGVFDEVLHEGKVKNVSYKIRFPFKTLCFYNRETLVKLEMKAQIINKYVPQALNKIFDLGMKVNGERTLNINIETGSDWGGFSESWLNQNWSEMSLGITPLLDPNTTEEDIRCTVIHELFHFVQSNYDGRCQFEKGCFHFRGGGEDLIMYEMGAVWSEYLLNNGQLNASWLLHEALIELLVDGMGFSDVLTRHVADPWNPIGSITFDLWNPDWANIRQYGPKYQNQGYSMAPMLYYLCSTKEMSAFKFDSTSVAELHEEWSKHFSNSNQTMPTLSILDDWAEHKHDSHFFVNDGIDDFHLKLLCGEVVKGIDIFIEYDSLMKPKGDELIKNLDTKLYQFEGTNYPYGYAVKSLQFYGLKDATLKDKKLVIKQETEGMQTYLLTANRKEKKFERIGTVAKGQDSIVVTGNKLESYRKADGSIDQYFFMVTTRTTNATSDTGKKSWKATAELQDAEEDFKPATVNPKTISFDVYGGYNYDVKIDKGSYKYCDVEVPSIFSTWLKASVTDDGKVTIIAEPNETTENRQGTVNCWVSTKPNPTDAEKKYLTPSVTVIQQGGVENTGNASVEPTTLDFPAVGGSKYVAFDYGAYSYYGKTLSDAALEWIRTDWSIDYLDVIGYSSTNRFAKQFYVNVFPNPSNTERVDTVKMSFYYTKGAPWNERYVVPVIIRQDAGPATLADMKKLFVGKWWSKYDKTSAGNDKYNYQRYTFNADNTFAHETSIAIDGILPPTWDMEKSGTYSITSYKVLGHRVQLQIQLQVKEGYYNCIVEVFPHFMYLAYYNNAGMLVHGVYLEKI